jgi:hypothetical protein
VFSLINRIFALVAVVTALALTPLAALAQATPSPAVDPATSLQRGVDWLLSQQGDEGAWIGFTGESDPGVTIDAVLALTAAANAGIEVDLTSAAQYLDEHGRDYVQAGAGQAAKMIQAAVALGEDPTTFADINSVRWMLSGTDESTRIYGTSMYDTALVILALVAMGEPAPNAALRTIKRVQLDDGSWSFDGIENAANGDTNTTAIVIQALIASGDTKGKNIERGIQYLQESQLPGGFAFQLMPDAVPDANSTALVVQALIAAGEDPSAQEWQNALGSLIAFQTPDGAFSYQLDPLEPNLFATVQAIPVLAGQAFPVVSNGSSATAEAVLTCMPLRQANTFPADAPVSCAA